MMRVPFGVILLILSLHTIARGERLHEQIYSSIEGGAACFRRLNGTHQAGCSSADNGAVGAVQMIKDVNDAKWLIYNSTAGPYIAVVSTALFNSVIMMLVDKPDTVAGVLLFDNATESASHFSQDLTCPNEYASSDGNQCTGGWNKLGTGLMRMDIPFPIFYLPKSRAQEIQTIEECYDRHNVDKYNQNGKPLCSVQLTSFMFAAVNSEICLRRSATTALLTPTKVCDPLGDHNVYYSLFPRIKDAKSTNVTFVTARIDSASLFDGVSPGVASSVIGMVTLLTAATTLSKLIPVTDAQIYDHNILWTLFNGEAFDYIGSDRVAYDINRRTWPANAPLAPDDISLHVEVGQIGGALMTPDSSWPFFAYTPENEQPSDISVISEFLNILSVNTQKYNMSVGLKVSADIPPSSLYAFRKFFRNLTDTGKLPELLLVDHEDSFTNLFYNSVLDTEDKIGFVYRNITVGNNGTFESTDDLIANGTMKENDSQVKVARFATALAYTLYQRVTGKPYNGNLSASAHLVDEMLYCFLESQACRLIMAADYYNTNDENLPARPAPLYVGVAAWTSTAPVFAGHLLALLTGTHLTVNKTVCDKMSTPGYSQYWLRGWNSSGVCIQTTMNFSQAMSPAFFEPDYDWSSGKYSTWSESVWQSMSARVFVSAGGGGARAAAVAGCVATALAAALTFWLQKHAHLVFNGGQAASVVNDDAASGILRSVNC